MSISPKDTSQDDKNAEYQHSSQTPICTPSTSPFKPVLLAGNALQLELGESETPFTANHVIVSPYLSPSESSLSRSSQEFIQPPPPMVEPPPPSRSVRFRSRVRISGLRHAHSLDSSGSGSPSSSISIPLESNPRGVLGQRLSMLSPSMWQKRSPVQQRAHTAPPSERTPLIRPASVRRYSEPRNPDITPEEGEEEEDVEERARREEEIFGKWPWKAMNRHWWWRHMEPVVCFCCADDSDDEETADG